MSTFKFDPKETERVLSKNPYEDIIKEFVALKLTPEKTNEIFLTLDGIQEDIILKNKITKILDEHYNQADLDDLNTYMKNTYPNYHESFNNLTSQTKLQPKKSNRATWILHYRVIIPERVS